MKTNVLFVAINKVKSTMQYDKIIVLTEDNIDDNNIHKDIDHIKISKKCKYASEEYNSIKQQIKSAGENIILIS